MFRRCSERVWRPPKGEASVEHGVEHRVGEGGEWADQRAPDRYLLR